MDQKIAGELSGQDLLIVLAASFGGWVAGSASEMVVRAVAKRVPERSVRRAVLDAFDGPLQWFAVAASTAVAIDIVVEAALLKGWWAQAFFLIFLPFVLWFALRLNGKLMDLWAHRADGTDSTFDDQLVPVVRTGIKVSLWVVAALLLVQNMGGEVGSLLAGFGLGGLAVAMASKDTIANLFGSVVIFVDRPFVVGDWVEIGEHEGVVEEVGLRVTRIRTFAKSLITVPNSSLTTTAINNWSRMHKRRIKMSVGITYDADAALVERAVEVMREVMNDTEGVESGTGVLYFEAFGSSSLDIFVYCFADDPDWEAFLAARQRLLLGFMRALSDLGVELAFPTQTVHIASQAAAAAQA